MANLDKERDWRPLHPKEQADYDQARQVVARDTVERLQKQTNPLTEAQKQEMADALNTLGGSSDSSSAHGPGGRPQNENGAVPDRGLPPGSPSTRGIELPNGRRGGGSQDSNLVPAGGSDGGHDPLQGGAAAAAPPSASAAHPLPAAVGQMMSGPAGTANPDAPRASAGGGDGAGSQPTHPAQGLPPQTPPPTSPNSSDRANTLPSRQASDQGVFEHPSPPTSQNQAPDSIGHARKKFKKDKIPVAPEERTPLSRLPEQDQFAVQLGDQSLLNVKGYSPTMTCVVFVKSTGQHFGNHSKNNVPEWQPKKIAPELANAIEGQVSAYKHPITNCAEFNAVNDALLAGVALRDIVLRTIYTKSHNSETPCLNCRVWIEKLGIRVIEGDYKDE